MSCTIWLIIGIGIGLVAPALFQLTTTLVDCLEASFKARLERERRELVVTADVEQAKNELDLLSQRCDCLISKMKTVNTLAAGDRRHES